MAGRTHADHPACDTAFAPGRYLAGRADQRRADRLGHAIEYHDALTAEITSVAYGPDGRLCATASADHRVLLWDAKSFQQLRKLLFLSREGVERFLFEAHQRGLLEYHVAGSVTRLTFAANTLEEYANVLAQR